MLQQHVLSGFKIISLRCIVFQRCLCDGVWRRRCSRQGWKAPFNPLSSINSLKRWFYESHKRHKHTKRNFGENGANPLSNCKNVDFLELWVLGPRWLRTKHATVSHWLCIVHCIVHFRNSPIWTDLAQKKFERKALFFGDSYSKSKTSSETHMNRTFRKKLSKLKNFI